MRNIRDKVFGNHALRAILLAIVLLVVGELLLAWQYQNLNRGRLAQVEQKLAEQEHIMEERAAQDALQKFLEARVAQDERKLVRYITENAMAQRARGSVEFYGVEDYAIEKKEQIAEGSFRFHVSLLRNRLSEIEFVNVVKILDQYYIDSIELAG